jgi:hypothetical protein
MGWAEAVARVARTEHEDNFGAPTGRLRFDLNVDDSASEPSFVSTIVA